MNSFKKAPVQAGPNLSLLMNGLTKLRWSALSAAVMFLAVGVAPQSAYAATPGLPFVEDFTDTNLQDAGATNADWDTSGSGILLPMLSDKLGNALIEASVVPTNLSDDEDQSRDIALGDVDGDGDLDAVVGNQFGRNRLYLNNGSAAPFDGVAGSDIGTFNSVTRSVVLADVDRDGDLDVMFGNTGQANRLYLNDGTSDPFSGSAAISIGSLTRNTWLMEAGDLDGDGDLDLITGNSRQTNRVYMNRLVENGTFSFNSGADISFLGDTTRAVKLGDVDNDGDLDLVVINFEESKIVYRNQLIETGTFFFDGGAGFGSILESFTAELADLDSDGDLDLLEGTQGTTNRVLFNNGAGVFSGETTIAPDVDTTVAMVVGDLDRDGDIDVLAGNNRDIDRVYFNDGNGDFSSGTNVFNESLVTYGLAIGDIDRDGDLDVVEANQGEATGEPNRTFLNNGTPNVFAGTVASNATSDSTQTRAIAIADINNDGDLDLVNVNGGGSGETNRYYLGNGVGNFSSGVNIASPARRSNAVDIGDLDLDGDLDIIVGNQNNRNRYYLNTLIGGSFGFTAGTDLDGTGRDTFGGVLVDVDGDTDLDLIYANDNNQRNRLYTNLRIENGVFSFSTASDLSTDSRNTRGVAVGDLDNDGDVDIVTGNRNQGDRFYVNNGSGNFSSSDIGTGLSDTRDVLLGDFDADGDLDFVQVNENTENRIFLNNFVPSGVLSFDNGTNIGSDTQDSRGVDMGDFDGDGNLDLVVANRLDTNRFYAGNGDGTFEAGIVIFTEFRGTEDIVAVDIDGDTDLDLMTGEEGTADRLFQLSDLEARTLFGVAQSIRVDTEISNIASATLQFAGTVPDHAKIDFFMSNDGGTTFHNIVPNVPFQFPTTGTDLRWNAKLDTLSPLNLPSVTSINIALNAPPAPVGNINTQNATQGTEFGPLDVSGNFTDPDGDDLIFTLEGLPQGTGLSIDTDTGVISGTPTNADAEASPLFLTARASDGGLSATQNFTMNVTNVNDPPVFTSNPPLTAIEGLAYQYDITATDIDSGDVLTITAPTLPGWLTLTPTGPGTATLAGTPGTIDVGDNVVQLQVSDTQANVLQDFTITVLADSDGDTVPDINDAFPNDPNESVDTDGDGIGNNADTDDDDDGIPDQFEIDNGLDPLDPADAALDPDGDTVSNLDEFLQGTDPQETDTDSDGADDAADNCPIDANPDQADADSDGAGDACDQDFLRTIAITSDVNGNGSSDVAAVRITPGLNIETQVSDGDTGGIISTFNFFNPDWAATELLTLEGAGTTGGPALGLAARRVADNVPAMQVRNANNGGAVSTIFPLSNAWRIVDTDVIDGYAPGGGPAIATLAQRRSDGLPAIEMMDVATGLRINIVFPLGIGWTPLQLDILQVNGAPALAALMTRDSDSLTDVQVVNAATGALIRNVFPLGFGWSPNELKVVPDLTGNNADEIAVRMTRDADGLEIIQLRDGLTQDFINNVFPIGAGALFETQQFEVVNTNGVISLGIFSIRDSDNQVLVQTKNALTSAILNNVFFLPPPWEFQQAYRVMPNSNGGDDDELAVLMRNTTNGDRLVQIRDSETDAVLRNIIQPD